MKFVLRYAATVAVCKGMDRTLPAGIVHQRSALAASGLPGKRLIKGRCGLGS